jgi:hypothetical protein
MITVVRPALLMVTAIVRLLPTVTFPKLADDGLKTNFPAVVPPNLALVSGICPSALAAKPIIASRMTAILTTIRNCAFRSLWLLKMVSGETAKKLTWKNDGRGPMDCIQRSLYVRGIAPDTDQESRLRAKPSVALMGRASLSFGPFSLRRILAVGQATTLFLRALAAILIASIRQIPSSSFCPSALRADVSRPAGRRCLLFP